MTETFITSAPNYIPVLNDNKGFWIQVVLASITFLAVLIALFQEKIKGWFTQSMLDMRINLAPPDCHQIMQTATVKLGKQWVNNYPVGNAIYIRILVENINNRPGDNAEIMVSKFNKIAKNKTATPVKHFLPMNLKWSHFQPPTHVARVPSSLFRHCDLAILLRKGSQVVC